MAKAVTGAGKTGEPTTPKEFAETTPTQVGPDMTTWLLNAVSKNTETLGKVDATLVGLKAQVDRIETKLDAVKEDVKGHGTWIHTFKVALLGAGILVGWAVVYIAVPRLKAKLAQP
jgi:hypothetical protein